jgi:sugar lactone lactonase YvrE
VAIDGAGNLYFADPSSNVIRKVAAATGIITTVAGNGTFGYSGDGGLATNAQFNGPSSAAVDGAGNLYIADWFNAVIRKVTAATGIITTVAGNGTLGYSGDGGPATSAELSTLVGVVLDDLGDLYIADSNNAVIRKVAARTGIITTVAGNGTPGFSGDGGPATSAELSELCYGGPVAVDGFGTLYIADCGNNRVRKVPAGTGVITTVAGNGRRRSGH